MHIAFPIGVVIVGAALLYDNKKKKLVDIANRYGSGKVLNYAYHDLSDMIESARQDGIRSPLLTVVSGYRSWASQKKLFEQAVARYGSEEKARTFRAPPGNSTHETGRAVDFYLGAPNDSENIPALRKTKAYKWLDENAEKFNFFPYEKEPWHWEWGAPHSTDSSLVRNEILQGRRLGYLA